MQCNDEKHFQLGAPLAVVRFEATNLMEIKIDWMGREIYEKKVVYQSLVVVSLLVVVVEQIGVMSM